MKLSESALFQLGMFCYSSCPKALWRYRKTSKMKIFKNGFS